MAVDFSTSISLTNATPTTLLNISSTGYVTKPLQPSFNANGVVATTAGSYVIYPSTTFNIGGCYNTANGRFTAPVAGVYYFYFNHITNATTAGEYRIIFYKNAAWYSGSCYISVAPATTYLSLYGNQHIALAANDYVNVIYSTGPAALYGGAGDTQYGQFSGHLIG